MRKLVVLGYIIVSILICSIVCKWYQENQKLISQTKEISKINNIRKGIREIYISIAELSLSGEIILEWDDADWILYTSRRITVDSMLCRLSSIYPTEHIDSVRCLLENKEKLIRNIVQVLDEQEAINAKIARQVPVIAQKSTQEQPKKSKRKGFLGLFGKKEEPKPTVTTTMLYTLNRDIITRQQAQNRRLAEYTDSLATRNGELNHQLQSLIHKIDESVQSDLQQREAEIIAMRDQSFIQIGSLTGFILLLLVVSYIIIHIDTNRIKRYKEKTARLISELQESAARNEELISSRKKAMYTITHELRTPLRQYMAMPNLSPTKRTRRK